MPNSLIICWLSSVFSAFVNALKNSKVAKLFNKIYEKISSGFLNSKTARIFSKKESENKSLTYKIFNFPIYILNFLSKLLYKPLTSFTKKSMIAYTGNVFYNCCASVNLRFFGAIATGLGLFGICTSFLTGSPFIIFIVSLILGFALMIKPVNISEYLKDSLFVKIIFGIF